MKSVLDLDVAQIQNFKEVHHQRYEHIPWQLVSAELFVDLQAERMRCGVPLELSPVKEAWVRTDLESRTSGHFAKVDERGRPVVLSRAGDVFPKDGKCFEAFNRLRQSKRITKLGLYIGTEPRPMIHIGIDDTYSVEMIVWACEQSTDERTGKKKQDYYYLSNSAQYKNFDQICENIRAYNSLNKH